MKTNQTKDKTSDKTGKSIDFRKDTPPTDWLAKRVEERYGHLPPADIKTEYDFVEEFIAELSGLRCEPNCANGQPAVDCICSLLKEMICEETPLVPKDEFLAVVEAAGFSQEDALEHYRNYALTKFNDEHKEEFIRLIQERENAHNWWVELGSDEARSQASEAGNEIRALDRKIDRELEAIMTA